MKNTIDCDFKSSSSIKSSMQPTVQVDNKIVSNNTINVIDTTRSAVDSRFGNQIDVTTQVESLTNQLKISILAETDAKIENVENKITYETQQTLNTFEHQQDIKIENRLEQFEQDIDVDIENRLDEFEVEVDTNIDNRINILGDQLNTRIDIFELDVTTQLNQFEEKADKKYVPQRLNAFGTMDISGDIVPNKAFMYVDVPTTQTGPKSTKVDLADVITTKIVTEEINPDTNLRTYDYIFTKLVREGD